MAENLQSHLNDACGDAGEDDDIFEHGTFMSLLESDELEYVSEQPIILEYVCFPLQIVKTTLSGKDGTEICKLQDAKISFLLDFQTIEEMKKVKDISISVVNSTHFNSLTIPNVALSRVQETKVLVKVDLNSATDGKNNGRKEAYKIRKKCSDNKYMLLADIHLKNGSTVQESTRSFEILQGSATTAKSVRKRKLSSDIDFASERVNDNEIVNDEVHDLIKAQNIICDYIKTQFLTVDGESIKVGKTIASPNGDIAYHFHLDEDEEMFEEGEVVGLLPPGIINNDIDTGKKQNMRKLSFDSSSQALIKGVVTRSQYLEAMKPSSGISSETIAMMGVVPVQVRGQIQANEPLYASPLHPGFAVSAAELAPSQQNEAAFVGHALTSRQTDDVDSTGMVQAAVSILQNCVQKQSSEKVNKFKRSVEGKIDEVDHFGSHTRHSISKGVVVSALVFILAAFVVWQLITPGSALQYYQCQRGRKFPYSEATFSMQPYRAPHITAIVNGIEFDFHELLIKAGHEKYPKLELPGVRYYLNIDRCAYGYVTYGDVPSGTKRVLGPTVFGVDEKCFRSYYFDESTFSWIRYNSASWLDFRNICCTPRSKWKSCKELKESKLCSTITQCHEI